MKRFPQRPVSARWLCSAMVLAMVTFVSGCGASKDEARNSCLSAAGLDAQKSDGSQGHDYTYVEPFDTTLEGHTFFIFHAVPGTSATDYRLTVGSCHFKDGTADYEITAQHVMTTGPGSIDDATNWFRQTFGPDALAVMHRMRDAPDAAPTGELASILQSVTDNLRR